MITAFYHTSYFQSFIKTLENMFKNSMNQEVFSRMIQLYDMPGNADIEQSFHIDLEPVRYFLCKRLIDSENR